MLGERVPPPACPSLQSSKSCMAGQTACEAHDSNAEHQQATAWAEGIPAFMMILQLQWACSGMLTVPGCSGMRIARDIALGLAYLHQASILHCDIKSASPLWLRMCSLMPAWQVDDTPHHAGCCHHGSAYW